MKHHKPYFTEINTNELCEYGCNQPAKYQFKCGKKCCSKHFNSCTGKRKQFSNTQNHKENARKSLETRTRLGITKTSQIKGAKTRRENGFIERHANFMRQLWLEKPWKHKAHCKICKYKDTNIAYQGSYEFAFLEKLEIENGLDWLLKNVSRGPSFLYFDEVDKERVYISDYQIGNTIYEIKSSWTWDKQGTDKLLRIRNQRKLKACVLEGYQVKLILDGEQLDYEHIKLMD